MKYILLVLIFFEFLAFTCYSANANVVVYNVIYKIDISGKTSKVKFVCLVPNDINNVQRVLTIKYSREPLRVYEQNGNKFAEFLIENEKGLIQFGITTQLELLTHDLKTVKKGTIVTIDLPDKYLMSEKYIQKDNSQICSIGRSLLSKDTLKTIQRIYNFVNKNMKYNGYNYSRKGAVKALEQFEGDCTEFADLFVALCRSCNFPSMVVDGYFLDYSVTPKHSWAEVYCGQYGWVRFDPTPGNQNIFNKLVNQYIQLYTGRNDENISDFNFYRYTYWGDAVSVTDEIRFL